MSDHISTTLTAPLPRVTKLAVGQGPAGVGYNPANFTATEALAAGDFVNISGAGVRKASRANYSRTAHGFVTTAVASGAVTTVQFGGINSVLAGLTVGPVWLGVSGAVTSTALSVGPGMVQPVGYANSATSVNFQPGLPVVLAGTPA